MTVSPLAGLSGFTNSVKTSHYSEGTSGARKLDRQILADFQHFSPTDSAVDL